MRVLAVIVTTLTLAALAYATGYFDEKFEGGFPPPRWTVTRGSGAGWDGVSGGPTGDYAKGWAFSTGSSESWARLDTFAFYVPANTTVEFRYDYKYVFGGLAAPNYAELSLFYVGSPEEVFTSAGMALTPKWVVFTGKPVAERAGAVKARFEVWVKNPDPSHTAVYAWDVDNVVIAKAANHAVSPTSLGRVKALYG